ncbi:MAG: glycosyltransferase family 2 protein [Deltaproteobacteria bacterium]
MIEHMRKVSIVTPSLNQGRFIEETIKSVQGQEYRNLEHIIVDGGSKDDTLNILRKYEGKIHWISEKDEGQADAVNKGFRIATGEIIGWLNSDDLYLPGTIRKVVDFFENNPAADWLYGRCRIIDENGQLTRKWISRYKNLLGRKFRYRILLLENFISQPSVFFKKSVVEAIGQMDTKRCFTMDYEYWLRIAGKFEPGVLREDLACFRIHQECKSYLGFKRQFREEFEVAKTYSTGRLVTLIHWFNYWKIVTIYRLMNQRSLKKGSISGDHLRLNNRGEG